MNKTCIYMSRPALRETPEFMFNIFFHEEGLGFYSEILFDEDKMSSEERREHLHDQVMQSWFATLGLEQEKPKYFPSLELAIRYVELQEEEVNLSEELSAFHAPSECGERAFRRIDQERELLLQSCI